MSEDASDRRENLLAQAALRPEVGAASAIARYSKELGQLDTPALIGALTQLSEQTSAGDLSRMEALLTAQASTLNAVFNRLIVQALDAPGLDLQERAMRLAFKAQSQCRATVESLAAIKIPRPVAFVQQANISAAPQQVNNGSAEPASLRARKSKKRQNELLEAGDGKRLDRGTPRSTGRNDPAMAPVGKLDRTTKRGWQGNCIA